MSLVEVKVPDIGDFDAVPIIDLFVKVGDSIKVDDAICTLESDKATMDVPSPAAGVVQEVLVKLGDKVAEGTPLIKVETAASTAAAPAASASAAPAAPAPAPASRGAEVGRLNPPVGARPAPAAIPAAAGRIDKSPRQATAAEQAEQRYRMAIDLAGRGQVQEAEHELRLALQSDPTHGPARQFWVKLLLDQRAVAPAMEVLREGLNGNPRQTQWAMLLARLELESGDVDQAWATLQRALPAASRDGEYLAFAGALLRQRKQALEAAGYYRQALTLDPRQGRWWVGLALALEEAGHAPEAREAFRQAARTGNLSGDLQAFVERKLR